eukprot:367264-Amorphochlora_amoeboformis.AAC.1
MKTKLKTKSLLLLDGLFERGYELLAAPATGFDDPSLIAYLSSKLGLRLEFQRELEGLGLGFTAGLGLELGCHISGLESILCQ